MREDIDRFIQAAAEAATQRELEKLFVAEIKALGYDGYDAFSHIFETSVKSYQTENFISASYDMRILEPYLQDGLAEICPCLTRICTALTPFEYVSSLDLMAPNSSVAWQKRTLAWAGVRKAWCVPLSTIGVMQAVTVYMRGKGEKKFRRFEETRELIAALSAYFMEALLAFRGGQKEVEVKGDDLTELLSPREVDCLQWLTHGKSNREIAGILSISDNTVHFHVKNVFRKLGVDSRTQAANKARKAGMSLLVRDTMATG
ncbi:MAG: response regulator transcription factor [Pikeienuella sp.]